MLNSQFSSDENWELSIGQIFWFPVLLWPAVNQLFRLFDEPQVRLQRFPALGILRLGFFVTYGRHDNAVAAVLPVRGRGNSVRGGQLDRVDHAKDCVVGRRAA